MSNAFNDPSYAGLLSIYRTKEVPAFVKEAAISEEQELGQLGSELFADMPNRRYPMDTASNTWLSREYFSNQKSQYLPKEAAYIEHRLQKAAEFWKLESSKNKTETKASSSPYTVKVTHESEPMFEFSIGDKTQYKEAAEHLIQNKATLTYDMRRSFARGLLSAPLAVKANLPLSSEHYLQKAAGLGITTPQNIRTSIYRRLSLLGDSGKYAAPHRTLTKLAKAVESGSSDIGLLHKTAQLLDLVDRAFELNRNYSRGLPTPEDELFAFTEKVAECSEDMIELVNGHTMNKSDLLGKKDMIDDFFDKYMGEVPYEDGESMIVVIKSLPKPDADALVETLDAPCECS